MSEGRFTALRATLARAIEAEREMQYVLEDLDADAFYRELLDSHRRVLRSPP